MLTFKKIMLLSILTILLISCGGQKIDNTKINTNNIDASKMNSVSGEVTETGSETKIGNGDNKLPQKNNFNK